MALTQGAWTQKKSTVSGMQVWTNNVAFTTAENDAYTLKTPATLDTTKQWTLLMTFAATPDGVALPIDLWGGYADDFALSGDGATVAATDGYKIRQILDDGVAAVSGLIYSFVMDPALPITEVVAVASIASGFKVRVPVLPYYAINCNGGSTLNATNVTFTIIQVN